MRKDTPTIDGCNNNSAAANTTATKKKLVSDPRSDEVTKMINTFRARNDTDRLLQDLTKTDVHGESLILNMTLTSDDYTRRQIPALLRKFDSATKVEILITKLIGNAKTFDIYSIVASLDLDTTDLQTILRALLNGLTSADRRSFLQIERWRNWTILQDIESSFPDCLGTVFEGLEFTDKKALLETPNDVGRNLIMRLIDDNEKITDLHALLESMFDGLNGDEARAVIMQADNYGYDAQMHAMMSKNGDAQCVDFFRQILTECPQACASDKFVPIDFNSLTSAIHNNHVLPDHFIPLLEAYMSRSGITKVDLMKLQDDYGRNVSMLAAKHYSTPHLREMFYEVNPQDKAEILKQSAGKNGVGGNTLTMAVMFNPESAVFLLTEINPSDKVAILKHKACYGLTPAHIAAALHPEILESLFTGIDPINKSEIYNLQLDRNIPGWVSILDITMPLHEGWTPAMYACQLQLTKPLHQYTPNELSAIDRESIFKILRSIDESGEAQVTNLLYYNDDPKCIESAFAKLSSAEIAEILKMPLDHEHDPIIAKIIMLEECSDDKLRMSFERLSSDDKLDVLRHVIIAFEHHFEIMAEDFYRANIDILLENLDSCHIAKLISTTDRNGKSFLARSITACREHPDFPVIVERFLAMLKPDDTRMVLTQQDHKGKSILAHAIENHADRYVEFLIRAMQGIETSPEMVMVSERRQALWSTIRCCRPEYIPMLISNLQLPQLTSILTHTDAIGNNVMHHAARTQDIEEPLRLLLDHIDDDDLKASLMTQQNNNGYNPLMTAVCSWINGGLISSLLRNLSSDALVKICSHKINYMQECHRMPPYTVGSNLLAIAATRKDTKSGAHAEVYFKEILAEMRHEDVITILGPAGVDSGCKSALELLKHHHPDNWKSIVINATSEGVFNALCPDHPATPDARTLAVSSPVFSSENNDENTNSTTNRETSPGV